MSLTRVVIIWLSWKMCLVLHLTSTIPLSITQRLRLNWTKRFSIQPLVRYLRKRLAIHTTSESERIPKTNKTYDPHVHLSQPFSEMEIKSEWRYHGTTLGALRVIHPVRDGQLHNTTTTTIHCSLRLDIVHYLAKEKRTFPFTVNNMLGAT